jgi:hypothetical protein
MKNPLPLLLVLGSLAVTGLAAQAAAPNRVEVNFAEPEKFTDVRRDFTSAANDPAYLHELASFLERDAVARLAPGTRLSVTFTNIDLAGDFEPWREGRWADVRIVQTLYPARLSFHFAVTDASDAVLRSGERELRDLTLTRLPGLAPDPLRFEKGLLDDWLSQEFPRARR